MTAETKFAVLVNSLGASTDLELAGLVKATLLELSRRDLGEAVQAVIAGRLMTVCVLDRTERSSGTSTWGACF